MSADGGSGAAPAGGRAVGAAARRRAAVETYSRHEAALRRTAGRYSLCAADAEDALQRALEILLTKAPTTDPRELIRWTQTVVKHEALAVRRERERILAGPAAGRGGREAEDWVALIPSAGDGPAERAERREAVARSREALQALKPQELRALSLLAEGYSYAEIGEITGFSRTKINRCLAEGRERFRRVVAGSADGSRCAEMGPLLSRFCDGEAAADEQRAVREHLRACAGCRAALRAYRAAPAAAAVLAPPLPRSPWERLHDWVADLAARFGGGGAADPGLTQTVAAGGARGAGTAALVKLAAVCAGTVGGAAACVAGGVVPAPLALDRPPVERAASEGPARPAPTAAEEGEVDSGPAPAEERAPAPQPQPEPEPEPAASEPPPAPPPPPASAGAVEYAPPPAPSASVSGGPGPSAAGAAGEFGP